MIEPVAYIHRTAGMVPTKLDLLTDWLPQQAWYAGRSGSPQLSRVGGFRLDDPAGEVGIEFFFVADEGGGGAAYHVPMSYRGTPLQAAESALIGTAEHGALGPRWVYDGTHDPVVMDALVALFAGAAEPQHQTESDTADPSVIVRGGPKAVAPAAIEVVRVLSGRDVAGDVFVEASWHLPDGSTRRGPVVVTR